MNKLFLILIVSVLMDGWVDTQDDSKPPTEPSDASSPDSPLISSTPASPKRVESYDQKIEKMISEQFKPSVEEIVRRTHYAGYLHFDEKLEKDTIHDICGNDHNTCEPKIMNWAAAPSDPKAEMDKKNFQSKRDKDYGIAIRKGTSQAEKELKKYGAEPFGGVLIPSLRKEAEKLETNGAKGRMLERKGRRTSKGSKSPKARNLKKKPKKVKKPNPKIIEEEPDVTTALSD